MRGETPVENARVEFERLMSSYTGDLADVTREEAICSGVPASWILTPHAIYNRVVLYFHGGGFTMGSVQSHLEILSRISRPLSARVLAIDYRLAPEHPFPAAIEDCVSAYRWLLRSGISPDQMVLAGSSAGAGLVMSTLLMLRDCNDPQPAAAVCLCPFVDMTLQGDSLTANHGRDWVTKSRVEAIVETYLAGADPAQPLASPVLADLSGLPPILIQAGRNEILVDDARRLAAYASSDGVQIELDIWPEMIHMWQLFAAAIPEGAEAIEKMAKLLKKSVRAWSE
ncbi:MAG: hypothetical protein A2W01_08695 [Candidatus Solincola sediminis]|uniref:Alpha/beta hydrolase fold-3 domain-containing protein n=1 Tax=Candidatus Solincola sediminis TaxID=1797199 RepID=A0A1F2WT33_9ACTN|nr:MAG: hypothetical protein A2Y75_07790 [Candidatus Solincola sediminis]OFW60278.1 MAG: hypothetical protein A2W01_08695 [Candidatus Solincola sediminis]